MKYLFHTVSLGKTGGSRVILNLSEILLKRGHEVTVVIDRKHVSYAVPEGLKIKHLTAKGLIDVKAPKADVVTKGETPIRVAESFIKRFLKPFSNGFKYFKYFLKLLLVYPLKFYWIRKYLKNYVPDLVATHNMYQDYEHLFFYKNQENFFLVVHNSPNEVFLERKNFRILPYSWYLKGVKIACVSHESELEYRNLFGFKTNICTIYNPLDFEGIRTRSREEILDEYKGVKYLLVVASLGARKRIDRAIRMLPILDKELMLLVLGEGPLKSDLLELASSLGVEGRVHFLGYDSNPYKYMKNASALILTADSEGLGMVLVEALITGTVVVSLDCPVGPREVLQGSLNQFLVPMRGRSEIEISESLLDITKQALSTSLDHLNYEGELQKFDQNYIAEQWEKLARTGNESI